ncbi:MAG: GNAT family N-acetyltransferase [Chroococcus sp. CMT-3BRIN-NPC107]|jgi:putative acetyltransferase|nr:GNAT family N-acetyltransferase [Chroococcus sp. CMT-3BRIN-NPC107]
MILAIAPSNPTCSAVRELIAELDCFLASLYPPESRFGLDIVALQHPSVTIFVAKTDNNPVGCGAIQLQTPGFAEIKRMYVRPAMRGKGIGTHLVSQIEAFAKQSHVRTLRLETGVYQPEAIHLYQKLGYYPIPPFDNYKEDPLCLFFEKPLI